MIEKLGLQLFTIRDTMNNAENIRESFRKIRALGYTVGQTAGCAIPFGLALVEALKGKEEADRVARQIVIR